MKPIASYLAKYAELEATLVHELGWSGRTFDKVVVIPAFDEAKALPTAIATVRKASDGVKALIIVVVNAAQDSPKSVHIGNDQCIRATWPMLEKDLHSKEGLPRSIFFRDAWGGPTLLINRFTSDHLLPSGEGVGLARKIGADIALSLLNRGILKTIWLHMTDADVQVPHDYFFRHETLVKDLGQNIAACIFPFEHLPTIGQPHLGDGLMVYELFLREYEGGLAQAKSPFAFQTIGSLLLINLEKYAAVRGFPRRQAAEDFYLLNKLAKLGSIVPLSGIPIQISERHSVRVPFGTGASTMKLEQAPFDQPVYYARDVFLELKVLLSSLDLLALKGRLDSDECAKAFSECKRPGIDALTQLGFQKAASGIFSNYPTAVLRQRHLREWFDAFRTMRWIHLVCEHSQPRLSARQRYCPKATDAECRSVLRQHLIEMRAKASQTG